LLQNTLRAHLFANCERKKRGNLPQCSIPIVVDLRNGVWPSIARGDIEERDESTAQAIALSKQGTVLTQQTAGRSVSHFLNEEKTTGSWLPNMETATTAAAEPPRIA
jgi:hypothetical protein